MMVASLGTKYTSLNAQMDKIIHDANSEISDLRIKMKSGGLTPHFLGHELTSLQTSMLIKRIFDEEMKNSTKLCEKKAINLRKDKSFITSLKVEVCWTKFRMQLQML